MNISKKYTALIPITGVGVTGIYFAYSLSGDEIQYRKDSTDHEAEPVVTDEIELVEQVQETEEEEEEIISSDPSDDSWKTESIKEKFPNDPDYIIDYLEKLRKDDPVQYRSFYSRPEGREISFQKGIERVEIMRDYTMMIRGCNGLTGTGWILDYVLPDEKNGETYPKTWFIASNAHVYNAVSFDRKNPYNQLLNDVYVDHGCYWDSGVTLFKERVQHDLSDFDRKKWKGNVAAHMQNDRKLWDVSQWKNTNPKYDPLVWRYFDKNPKLFYYPYQYLGTDKSKWSGKNFVDDNYAVDFAIMEVNFETEIMARLFTRNFYDKYDHVKGRKGNKALNFFAKPIAEKYTSQELLEKDIQTFGAGYTYNGISNKSTSNYDVIKRKGSRFGYYKSIKDSEGRSIMGHADFSEDPYYGNGADMWNGKRMHKRGYEYAFEDHWLSSGASGALWAEEDGDVLGALSSSEKMRKIGFVEPLRNKEIKGRNGKVIAPAYDLMEGVPGQNGSYKEQVQKYLLKNGKQTALSRLRGWSS